MADALADLSENAKWLSQWLLHNPAFPLLTDSSNADAASVFVAGTDEADRLFCGAWTNNVLYGGAGRDTLVAGTGRGYPLRRRAEFQHRKRPQG